MRIEGVIIGAVSEPINGAPVVVSIQQDDGETRQITFERQCWNDFVYSVSEEGAFPVGEIRVVVEGEDEYNCTIREERFSVEESDSRGQWGYLLPSGRPAVKCQKCGKIILEEYELIIENGEIVDDKFITKHSCFEVDETPQG